MSEASSILDIVEAIRTLGGGRYACLLEPGRMVLDTPEPEDGRAFALRRLLEDNRQALFTVPAALAADAPLDDVFADWDEDEFFLAFLNGRVALVVACPDAEALKEKALPPLHALADRLLRDNPSYRVDPQGRGIFFSRPKLDLVVVGRTTR